MSLAKDKPYYIKPSDYEDDIHAWAYEQAQLLRLGRFSEVDLPNVIEEIESLGRESKLQLRFHYRDLVTALLQWQFSPDNRTPDLDKAIFDARIAILDEERDNRSLRDNAESIIRDVYPSAVDLAMIATGLAREHFPYACPYHPEFLRDLDALPGQSADDVG